MKTENIAQAPSTETDPGVQVPDPRHALVDCQLIAPYKELAWMPIGREEEGVAAASVQHSQALRTPENQHLTSFIKIGSNAIKGLTNSADNTMVYVVMKGELTAVLNGSQYVLTRGDTICIPPQNIYDFINMSQEEAELFSFQYRCPPKPTRGV